MSAFDAECCAGCTDRQFDAESAGSRNTEELGRDTEGTDGLSRDAEGRNALDEVDVQKSNLLEESLARGRSEEPHGTSDGTVAGTDETCILKRRPPARWDYFLCHKQSNGQDATLLLQMFLAEQLPGVRCWVDIEQDPTKHGMHDGVKHCQNFLLYLTVDVTKSAWVQQEIRWALQYKKNIVLVTETDERHGKPDIDALMQGVPSQFHEIFSAHVAIPFFRDPEFRQVSLNKIIRASELDRHQSLAPDEVEKTPLKFRSKRWSEDDEMLFDSWFVVFTTCCGIALPGACQSIKRWSAIVKLIILLCGVACASRAFFTEGPAFLDHETIAQIVISHPIIFWYLRVTLKILDSDLMRDMLENHIDARHDANRIRSKVRLWTVISMVSTAALTLWAWAAYLPGFFNASYLNVPGNRSFSLFVFGIGHGIIWIVVLPLFFGSLFCCVLMVFIIQELAYINIITCFNQLDTRVREVGLHAMLETNETLSISYQSLYRFQRAVNAAYQRYLKLHELANPAYLAFWLTQVILLPWSVVSFSKGFGRDPDVERAHRLQQHWFLIVRLAFFSAGSIFFGLPQWILALQPWSAHHYARCMSQIRRRIVVTQAEMLPSLMFILRRCDLTYRVGVLRTDLMFTPLYLSILLMNFTGWHAYAARLFLSI